MTCDTASDISLHKASILKHLCIASLLERRAIGIPSLTNATVFDGKGLDDAQQARHTLVSLNVLSIIVAQRANVGTQGDDCEPF